MKRIIVKNIGFSGFDSGEQTVLFESMQELVDLGFRTYKRALSITNYLLKMPRPPRVVGWILDKDGSAVYVSDADSFEVIGSVSAKRVVVGLITFSGFDKGDIVTLYGNLDSVWLLGAASMKRCEKLKSESLYGEDESQIVGWVVSKNGHILHVHHDFDTYTDYESN